MHFCLPSSAANRSRWTPCGCRETIRSSIVVIEATVFLATMFLAPASAAERFMDPPWRYTVQPPAADWSEPAFDDSLWQEGLGGFGTPETPGSRVGTLWQTSDIWLRRSIDVQTIPPQPALYIFHDEDAEVYLNGKKIASFQRWVTEYQVIPLDEAAAATLVRGKNLLAVHCHQSGGGQFIDVHLINRDQLPSLSIPNRPTQPFLSQLITPWGEKVTPENAWREYPRPALQRSSWMNLNGRWDYAITSIDQRDVPAVWDGPIVVPFALESKLSGVQKLLDPDEALWYRRSVALEPQPLKRMILNFEAVDYRSEVWVNGQHVGGHVGGNTPFSLDVSSAVRSGENEIVVRVEDQTEGFQLRGKQTLNPRGIWYTQVSGIWQTVWMEEVPSAYIRELDMSTGAARGMLQITPEIAGQADQVARWTVTVRDADRVVASGSGTKGPLEIAIREPKLWSPDRPHLYTLEISLLDQAGKVLDQVASYAGMRSIGMMIDAAGHPRMTLNGQSIFHWGPLDQGWWPDGLLTPPADEAMVFEIEFLKEAGFNMLRKHIKVEPRRYYYHCDRLGMMVWQDQVSGGLNPPWTRLEPNPVDAQWPDAAHRQFMQEFEEMVDELEFHPAIVMWVPFNEAWGQHRSIDVGKWIAERDPSRLVNIASGGNFWPVGNIVDHHNYPHPDFPLAPERFGGYVHVVGEFGGHGLPVRGHLWDADRENWGYGGLPASAAEYADRYRESLRLLVELKKRGIAAGIYTQTTDVEGEINGLMTYDRRVIKIPAQQLRELSKPLFSDP